MYTPAYLPKRAAPPQSGGDYISTISSTSLSDSSYTDPSTLSTTYISFSSLQYIMKMANITSAEALTTLTREQIKTLTDAIDSQISKDEGEIATTQGLIAELLESINGPNGLQEQFNLADREYKSSLESYHFTSSLLITNEAKYRNDLSTLSSLYALSSSYITDINYYQSLYDNLVRTLESNSTIFTVYERDYQASLQNLKINDELHNVALTNFSQISSIVATDLSQIPVNQPVYRTNLSTLNNISTQIVNYTNLKGVYEHNILSSYNNISTLLGPSSFILYEAGTLFSTINYYNGMNEETRSRIRSIRTDISGIQHQISDLVASNAVVLTGMTAEIENAKSVGTQFYDLYEDALDAECDEYSFAIQELNSQIGYITASLGIARNANIIEIDKYIFKILENPADTGSQNSKSELIATNDNIYKLIQQINSLDSQLSDIISIIGFEKTERNTFILQRKDIFKDYEAPALGWNLYQIREKQSDYLAMFSNLNLTIDKINSHVGNRTRLLENIQTIFNNPLPGSTGQSVRELINQYFADYLNTHDDQMPDNLLYVKDDDGNLLGGSVIPKEYNPLISNVLVSNGAYSFIPPIVF
jgi:hypothetical protein